MLPFGLPYLFTKPRGERIWRRAFAGITRRSLRTIVRGSKDGKKRITMVRWVLKQDSDMKKPPTRQGMTLKING